MRYVGKVVATILAVCLFIGIVPSGTFSFTASASESVNGNLTTWHNYGSDTCYISDCKENTRGAVIIPSEIDGYTVTGIECGAFENCKGITSVTLPNTIVYIAEDAFNGCNSLTTVNIPNSVTEIGDDAFAYCYKLNNVTIPSSVSNIGNSAFYGCNNLEKLVIEDGVLGIGGYAFSGCSKLKSVTLPKSIIEIGNSTFNDCVSLTTVSLPNTMISIGYEAFSGCGSLRNITIPSSIIEIGANAFAGTGLTSVKIPGSVTNISRDAFSGCQNLKTVIMAEGVVDIGRSAFFECSNLQTLVLPKTITKIGQYAFSRTQKIKNVYYGGSSSKKNNIAIGSNYDSTFLDVKWHYNTCDVNKHKYSAGCDPTCNNCDWIRSTSISHTYKTTTTKATTSKNGSIVKKCTVCGKVASSTTIKYAKTFKLSTTSYTYNGAVKTPGVTVKDSAGKTLKKNTDYTVTYASGRKNAGTYKVTIKGKGNYSFTKTLTFKINPRSISSYKLSTTSYTYNGSVKTPSVTVKNSSGTKLTKNTHYTVTYASGRKNVGTYKVTIKGKGNYTGTKTLTFKINPAKTTVSKLTAGKKSITVAITKKSTQVTGYQIQYSTSQKFTSAKTKTISSYKTTKYTLKSLSAKKIYYVRVRTYKTVGKTKYYSGWSTYKYIKTK